MKAKKDNLFFKSTASNNQGMIYGENGKTIAVIYDREDGYGELFASAPGMLEALNRIKSQLFGIDELTLAERNIARIADYAIAKAKGKR
jgi:hypothetical protein